MSSSLKQKKVKGVHQKLKLFRASEPLKSVLMWGVNYSFNQLNHVKPRAMLLNDDFKAYLKVKVINHQFNKENMPSRFKFKEYCPLVFQNLRERFNVDPMNYWDSFTKHQPVWDTAKGRSGSKFLLTYNKQYLVKTISTEEVEQIHHMLQDYHEYIVNCFANTRLPQYLGLYRITVNDQETYMLVMRHIFSPRLQVHRKYELKGSTVDREASEKEKKAPLPTLKDVDFTNDNCKVLIGQEEKTKLLQILERDVEFLQNLNLMDYSLIVGIHDPSKGNDGDFSGVANAAAAATVGANCDLSPGEEDDERDLAEEALDVLGSSSAGQSGSPLENSSRYFTFPPPPFTGELHSQYEFYGVKGVVQGSGTEGGGQVVYFLSLVDALTRYGMRKRTAAKYKTVKHGAGAEVSAVHPDVYAKRFLEFINQCLE